MLAKHNVRASGMSNRVKSGGGRGGCSQSGKM